MVYVQLISPEPEEEHFLVVVVCVGNDLLLFNNTSLFLMQ